MKVWIDKQGGTHYHKEDCPMTTGQPVSGALSYHYEPVEVSEELVKLRRSITVDGKRYSPCACMLQRRA